MPERPKGKYCDYCGVSLEPIEPVYKTNEHKRYYMPENGEPFGEQVKCERCYIDEIL